MRFEGLSAEAAGVPRRRIPTSSPGIDYDSPATRGGLSAQYEILAIDDVPMGSRSVDDALKTRRPGDKIKILVARSSRLREIEVVLGSKMQKSFKIQPTGNPTALQSEILKDWLRD